MECRPVCAPALGGGGGEGRGEVVDLQRLCAQRQHGERNFRYPDNLSEGAAGPGKLRCHPRQRLALLQAAQSHCIKASEAKKRAQLKTSKGWPANAASR